MSIVRTAYVPVAGTEAHPVEVVIIETDGTTIEYSWRCVPCDFQDAVFATTDHYLPGVYQMVESLARRHSDQTHYYSP